MLSMHDNHSPHRGFTLVEVVIVAPIILLTIGIFVGLLITITGEVLIARSSNKVAYDTHAALDMIEQDIRLSGSFLPANNLVVISPQGYNNGGTAFNNSLASQTNKSLILNTIASSGGPHQADRTPVWIRDAPNACAIDTRTQNQILTYNVVYFLKDATLWRRVIMPSNYTTKGCTVPDAQPSCNTIEATPAYPCITEDTRVLTDVSVFTVQYFATAHSTTPLETAAVTTAKTARVTITAQKTVAGEAITYSGSLRATRAGSLIDHVTPVP